MENVDIFTLSIDKNKFQSTNGIWNKLTLNDPWSVGYVSNLIEESVFTAKEDWEEYYYESGRKRREEISKLSSENQSLLDDFLLKKNNPKRINELSFDLKKLNTGYGRTKEDLMQKARVLHENTKSPQLSIDECFECIRYRVICETWNGIIYREKNTIACLKEMFPKIDFQKVSGEKDYQYAVDYELFLNSLLLGGIQIKPQSYLGNANYLQRAKEANKRKHSAYKNVFGKNVRFVIADMNGTILNKDDFLECLKKYYDKHIQDAITNAI